jgi:hypothetical protein
MNRPMVNQAMKRKLASGECIDVETVLAPHHPGDTGPAFAGVFRLRVFTDGVDYCVSSTEQWIWSIGKRASDGAIFAAIDGRFYQNPAFECLFLR